MLRAIETTQAVGLLSAAEAQLDAASRSAQFFLVLGICITLIAIVLAGIVSSSITRPLARLTEAVDQVATQQLPRLVESLRNPAEDDVKLVAEAVTDIEPGGGAELEHLGQAVTSIQHVAVEVATEQASLLRKGIGDMFVNLARRNQALLDRQIEFIDQLEVDEEDPDRLDDLFKLDHMATRMRRNAESLLVLAGAEPARRRGRPVPLADVVRAALGEVEDYTRIDLLTLDEVLVKSSGALDTAHLLSELMENATHFSPPDTRVEIVGHRTRSDGYVVSVTDHGIGMTPDQMADANELLAHPPLVGLAMSRSLGFIVIGRLAARIGVTVRLIPSPTGGVTAIVSLPATIVEDTLPRLRRAAGSEADGARRPTTGIDATRVPGRRRAPSGSRSTTRSPPWWPRTPRTPRPTPMRSHPSQWSPPVEPPRSGPQRHSSVGRGRAGPWSRRAPGAPAAPERCRPVRGGGARQPARRRGRAEAPAEIEPAAEAPRRPRAGRVCSAAPRAGSVEPARAARSRPVHRRRRRAAAADPSSRQRGPPAHRRSVLGRARNGAGDRSPRTARPRRAPPRLFGASERPAAADARRCPRAGSAATTSEARSRRPRPVERTASGLTRRTPRASGEAGPAPAGRRGRSPGSDHDRALARRGPRHVVAVPLRPATGRRRP